MAWQQAVSGWQNANSEIVQLKSVVTNLQKHVEELQAKTTSMDVAEPSGQRQMKLKIKIYPCALSTTNPYTLCHAGWNPRLCGEKPVANCPSYSTTQIICN
jgi:hypothetical protein